MSVADWVPVIPENERPELLDTKQMAAVLGIPESTLRRYSMLPGFPVKREPHLLRFWWRETIDYIRRMDLEGIEPPTKKAVDARRKPRKGRE